MLSNHPAESQVSPSQEAESGTSGTPVMNPRSPIEAASEGGGAINDPGGSDNKPPGVEDLDLFA